MDIEFQNNSGDGWRVDCVISLVFADDDPAACAPALWQRAPWLFISPALRDFSGKKDGQAMLYGHPEAPLSRVLLCGLGKRESFDLDVFRNAVARAVQHCRASGFARIGLAVEALDHLALITAPACAEPEPEPAQSRNAHGSAHTREILLREAAAAALLSIFRAGAYRSEAGRQKDETPADPKSLAFLFNDAHTPQEAVRAVRQGEAEAVGVNFARALGNGPANHVTPAALADTALKLSKDYGFACTVLDKEAIAQKGMGAFMAVARGAAAEPRFIIIEHCPKGKENDRPIIIAGKGVTFDSGGISLKPAAKMWEMKSDMGGAAAVLGFFAAIGELPDASQAPRLIGLVPATENMPGGNATRPGDVVTTLSGRTVEIMNTDAEGRLALCDALTYAQQEWNPAMLLDVATLTGACVVALGDYGTGLFTDDSGLRKDIMDAAGATGDLVWPLPLWAAYDENLKSDVADMSNMGPREGGSINAALFLRRFVEKGVRWAHLDIAGPGWVVKPSPLCPVGGATGVGVRLLCRLLCDAGASAAPR